jgi:hypothetical protein
MTQASTAVFGDQATGQPEVRSDLNGQPLHKIVVFHNHKGDVIIARHGQTIAWLDMSRDVAAWLAIELIEHAQMNKLALAAQLAASVPKAQVA